MPTADDDVERDAWADPAEAELAVASTVDAIGSDVSAMCLGRFGQHVLVGTANGAVCMLQGFVQTVFEYFKIVACFVDAAYWCVFSVLCLRGADGLEMHFFFTGARSSPGLYCLAYGGMDFVVHGRSALVARRNASISSLL